jgi:hypothetical protein
MYRESTETEAQEAIDPALAGVEFSQAPVAAVHFFRVMRDFFSYSVASCLIWMCLQCATTVSRLKLSSTSSGEVIWGGEKAKPMDYFKLSSSGLSEGLAV